MVAGFHLFPFRTEKLSPPAPMVLHTRGRVGSRRFHQRAFSQQIGGSLALYPQGYRRDLKGVEGELKGRMSLRDVLG